MAGEDEEEDGEEEDDMVNKIQNRKHEFYRLSVSSMAEKKKSFRAVCRPDVLKNSEMVEKVEMAEMSVHRNLA